MSSLQQEAVSRATQSRLAVKVSAELTGGELLLDYQGSEFLNYIMFAAFIVPEIPRRSSINVTNMN